MGNDSWPEIKIAWDYWKERTGHHYKSGIPEPMRIHLQRLLQKYGIDEVLFCLKEPVQKYLDFTKNPARASKHSMANAWNKLGGVLYNRRYGHSAKRDLVPPVPSSARTDSPIMSAEEFRHYELVVTRLISDPDDYSPEELLDGLLVNQELFFKALAVVRNELAKPEVRR